MKVYPILKRDEKHTTPGIAPDSKKTANMIIMLVFILLAGFVILGLVKLFN